MTGIPNVPALTMAEFDDLVHEIGVIESEPVLYMNAAMKARLDALTAEKWPGSVPLTHVRSGKDGVLRRIKISTALPDEWVVKGAW